MSSHDPLRWCRPRRVPRAPGLMGPPPSCAGARRAPLRVCTFLGGRFSVLLARRAGRWARQAPRRAADADACRRWGSACQAPRRCVELESALARQACVRVGDKARKASRALAPAAGVRGGRNEFINVFGAILTAREAPRRRFERGVGIRVDAKRAEGRCSGRAGPKKSRPLFIAPFLTVAHSAGPSRGHRRVAAGGRQDAR